MGHDGYLNQCKWLKNSVYYDVDDFTIENSSKISLLLHNFNILHYFELF